MPHPPVSRRPFSLTRALTQALALTLIPAGTAFAQSNTLVRVIRDRTDISTLRATKVVRMTAPRGTVLEVIHVEGDRYIHRDSNWYWVLLPGDPWGTRPGGWIRGDAVEHVPPPEPTPAAQASRAEVSQVPQAPQVQQARNEPSERAVPAPANPVEERSVTRPLVPDLVLNFQFGKSELTDEAKSRLASAVAMPNASTQGMSVALEGHADWTGPEAYNERLGLARAETVKRYLAEQLRIPADQISVVSYGESNPAAPNTTREGRARNRRVVIKVGA